MENKVKYIVEYAKVNNDNAVVFSEDYKYPFYDEDEAIEFAKNESIDIHNISNGLTHIMVHRVEYDEELEINEDSEQIAEFEVHEYIKASAYDVEYDVNELVKWIVFEYDVPDNFYGDCWNDDIKDLMREMRLTRNKRNYDEYLGKIEEILNKYAESYNE